MEISKDYYAILGVLPDAEPEVIRAVYIALAKKYHPDGQGKFVDEDIFKNISEAYEILSNPATRKSFDAMRSAQAESTGNYETSVDDEDLFVDDYEADWKIAEDYHPELGLLLKEIANISPSLSIVFQSTILSTKKFKAAKEIKEQLVSSFFIRYFGKNENITAFAEWLLFHNKMDAAKELNKVVKIFGEDIDSKTVILKIKQKYHLDKFVSTQWPKAWGGAYFETVYRSFGIYKMHGIGFKVMSPTTNRMAPGSETYSSILKAKMFIDKQ